MSSFTWGTEDRPTKFVRSLRQVGWSVDCIVFEAWLDSLLQATDVANILSLLFYGWARFAQTLNISSLLSGTWLHQTNKQAHKRKATLTKTRNRKKEIVQTGHMDRPTSSVHSRSLDSTITVEFANKSKYNFIYSDSIKIYEWVRLTFESKQAFPDQARPSKWVKAGILHSKN